MVREEGKNTLKLYCRESRKKMLQIYWQTTKPTVVETVCLTQNLFPLPDELLILLLTLPSHSPCTLVIPPMQRLVQDQTGDVILAVKTRQEIFWVFLWKVKSCFSWEATGNHVYLSLSLSLFHLNRESCCPSAYNPGEKIVLREDHTMAAVRLKEPACVITLLSHQPERLTLPPSLTG